MSVTVFGAFLIAVGIMQWANWEVVSVAGVAIIAVGGIFGYFTGLRPFWNQFARPRR